MSNDEDGGRWVVSRVSNKGFQTELVARSHHLVADEPVALGGTDTGPTPYEYLLIALGSCTAMTLRMYADRKLWPLEAVIVRLRDTPAHMKDCAECATTAVGPRHIDRVVELYGPLSAEQHKRLLQIADRCPVKQTLARGIQIRTVE